MYGYASNVWLKGTLTSIRGMHGDDPVYIHHQAFCQESLHHSAECSAEVNSRLYWDVNAPARRDLDSRRRAGAQDLVAGGQYEVVRKGFDVNAYDIRLYSLITNVSVSPSVTRYRSSLPTPPALEEPEASIQKRPHDGDNDNDDGYYRDDSPCPHSQK